MPWLRVDDRMYCNRKVNAVGIEAKCLWLWGMDYSADQLTDGILRPDELQLLSSMLRLKDLDIAIKELVNAGLLDCREDGNYSIHDYLEYNPSAAQVKKERDEAKERMRRLRSGEHSQNVIDPVPVPVPDPVPIPEPEPKKANGAHAPKTAATLPNPLSEDESYYLQINQLKRFSKSIVQREAISRIVDKYGSQVFRRAVDWVAIRGKSDLNAIETCARKMATGPPVKATSPPVTIHDRNMNTLRQWVNEGADDG